MKKPVFIGSAVALVTPFNEGGVDTKKLKALIDFHLAHKTDAIVVAATTGEAATMKSIFLRSVLLLNMLMDVFRSSQEQEAMIPLMELSLPRRLQRSEQTLCLP